MMMLQLEKEQVASAQQTNNTINQDNKNYVKTIKDNYGKLL